MNFFSLHPGKNRNDEPDKRVPANTYEPERNSMEGSEFLDDAIRIMDQPLAETEDNITPRSPEDLL